MGICNVNESQKYQFGLSEPYMYSFLPCVYFLLGFELRL
jgi:hypothetical protein